MSSGYQSIPQNESPEGEERQQQEEQEHQERQRRQQLQSQQQRQDHNASRRSSTDSITSEDIESQPLINHNHQFLDPDDPRVSPLRLYKVKVLRIVLITLIVINAILFFGFLLSDFLAIPGFNNRGKSFLELDLVLLNLLMNISTLWSLAVPTIYERVLGYLSAGFLFIDFVVILSVPYLRDQFGLVGNFLVLWTMANIIFNCFVDYWVEKGKHHQEIRYTGRIEKRRSFFELLVILNKVTVKSLLLLVILCISITIWLHAFDTHEQPWGKLIGVDDDQFKVHLSCYGDVHFTANDGEKDKQPILLLEGGQLTSVEEFQEWVEKLYHLNKIDRYCIWDRPGYAFSDSAPSPVSIGIITQYLMEALEKENIRGPFSLVGFDIGGLYSRMFAARNPDKIHSILLVDSWHEDLLKKTPFNGSKNEKKSVFKNFLELMDTKTGFKLWLKGLVSPLGIVPGTHWLFHPRRHSSNNRIFGSDMYYQPKYIRARLQEQVTSSILSYNEIKGTDLRNVPLSLISSDSMIKNSQNWGRWQRDLSKLSDNTIEWVIAENSSHFIWKSPKGKDQLQHLLLRLVGENSNS